MGTILRWDNVAFAFPALSPAPFFPVTVPPDTGLFSFFDNVPKNLLFDMYVRIERPDPVSPPGATFPEVPLILPGSELFEVRIARGDPAVIGGLPGVRHRDYLEANINFLGFNNTPLDYSVEGLEMSPYRTYVGLFNVSGVDLLVHAWTIQPYSVTTD